MTGEGDEMGDGRWRVADWELRGWGHEGMRVERMRG